MNLETAKNKIIAVEINGTRIERQHEEALSEFENRASGHASLQMHSPLKAIRIFER